MRDLNMLLVAGNMVIRRPGSGGGEAAPTVIIQGHIDMQVCKCQAVAGSAYCCLSPFACPRATCLLVAHTRLCAAAG